MNSGSIKDAITSVGVIGLDVMGFRYQEILSKKGLM